MVCFLMDAQLPITDLGGGGSLFDVFSHIGCWAREAGWSVKGFNRIEFQVQISGTARDTLGAEKETSGSQVIVEFGRISVAGCVEGLP